MKTGILHLEQMSNLQIYFPNIPSFAKVNLSDKSIDNIIHKSERDH